MFYLRQSTANQIVPLGPFLDPADFDTPKTGLTIANTDIQLWLTGASSLVNKNSGGATHMAAGVYSATLNATDTAAAGPLKIYVHVATASYVSLECCVLPQNVYDSFVAGTSQVTEATIAAEVVTEMNASSLLPTIQTAIADIPADLSTFTVDGTKTLGDLWRYDLAAFGGDATGMLKTSTTKVFKDQSGNPAITAAFTAGGDTRTVTLS